MESFQIANPFSFRPHRFEARVVWIAVLGGVTGCNHIAFDEYVMPPQSMEVNEDAAKEPEQSEAAGEVPDTCQESPIDEVVIEEVKPLTYEVLHADNACICTDDSIECDPSTIFVRRSKKDALEFNSQWENKFQIDYKASCDEVCGKKGVSLGVYDVAYFKVVDKMRSHFKAHPKYKPYLNYIRLHASSGCLKLTPSDYDPNHHDLYKSDTFDSKTVEVIEVIYLGDV